MMTKFLPAFVAFLAAQTPASDHLDAASAAQPTTSEVKDDAMANGSIVFRILGLMKAKSGAT